ncbi:hypothetical protein PV409_36275 [Streptomyces sp. ME02-6979.5a]|uniref:hypothetical protein n=1 Tax=Streptomyces sp. ME02-6979.5a TaxID=462925 RepID=UPI0029A764ED|nr:hypothetical protein [Streptomyces sp. ME02-6979.5a]MDX3343418.1 hypothetical protein [Streptomyces sp. ME02-6979.5a]
MSDVEEFEQGRQAPFTMLGDWVAVSGVDPNARSVYWDIKAHVNENRGTGTAWPPRDFLALLAGDKQARTMDPYLRQLEAIDAIGAERERHVAKMRSRNLYKIHDTPPHGWDGPASHAEVWEWLREDEKGCRQYYVDRKAWLKDIEDVWSRIKKAEKEQGAKVSAPVSKAGHRAWLKECRSLWSARRAQHSPSPRSAVQRTTEIAGVSEPPEAGPSEKEGRGSGSAVQRTTQCATAHPGSAPQRTGTRSKSNKKEGKDEAVSPRSGGDGRRPSAGSTRARGKGGFAASGKTSPSPTPNDDTRSPAAGKAKSGSKKAAHSREQLDTVCRVRAFFPPELLDHGLPELPVVSSAILTAMAEGRTVEQMRDRIWFRWANHGFKDIWAEEGRFEKPVGVAVALVRPLRRGDRFACPDLRCENGADVDTKEVCRLCVERLADWRAERARQRAQGSPVGANSARAGTGSAEAALPPQRAAQPREPFVEDSAETGTGEAASEGLAWWEVEAARYEPADAEECSPAPF